MTDFERLEEMYTKIGIPFVIDKFYANTPTVVLAVGKDSDMEGYKGFETELKFNTEGDLIGQGIWE